MPSMSAAETLSPEHPCATGLATLEHKLDTLLVEYAILSEAWPRAPGAVNRANIGRQVDAAVQLRRLEAMIEDPACRRLVASVPGVVEGAAEGSIATQPIRLISRIDRRAPSHLAGAV